MSDFAVQLAEIADLFARDATKVDHADSIPRDHLDKLATLGLYGAFAPISMGGLEFSLAELCESVELLASACLASTFVWIQHFRLLAAALDRSAPGIVADMRQEIVRGKVKGGVALTGSQPGPARLKATPTPEGWSLDGEAPWVSGWGLVDHLVVAARAPDDTVVTLLLDAEDQPGLFVFRRHLAALNASSTVKLTFAGLQVQPTRVLGQVPYDPTRELPEGLRVNGSLALGIVRRCCDVIGPSALDDELLDGRATLDGANAETMALARARACELAVRASSALAVHQGSSSVLTASIAERTGREAQVLLTFGSRPAIRQSLLELLERGVRRPLTRDPGLPRA